MRGSQVRHPFRVVDVGGVNDPGNRDVDLARRVADVRRRPVCGHSVVSHFVSQRRAASPPRRHWAVKADHRQVSWSTRRGECGAASGSRTPELRTTSRPWRCLVALPERPAGPSVSVRLARFTRPWLLVGCSWWRCAGRHPLPLLEPVPSDTRRSSPTLSGRRLKVRPASSSSRDERPAPGGPPIRYPPSSSGRRELRSPAIRRVLSCLCF